MNKTILIIVIFFITVSCKAESITERWVKLDKEYVKLVSKEKYIEALHIAITLNEIDPSNTKAMFYIVFSSLMAKKDVPSWLQESPWPNATAQDKYYKILAGKLMNGS